MDFSASDSNSNLIPQGPPIIVVDAFADLPFQGNPAAVCLLDFEPSEAWMHLTAREMNLSETAFLVPRPDNDGFGLRWFTPTVEVDLCGHATLASAHVLWELGKIAKDQSAVFHTRSGRLEAWRDGDRITMDFPSMPVLPDRVILSKSEVEQVLGSSIVLMGRNAFDLVVEVESEPILRSLQPEFQTMGQWPFRGVIVTCLSDQRGIDFVSRFFAPASGILEDPVTGSAHCCLGPYWAARLGKNRLNAQQVSERGGFVSVECVKDRVKLGGKAITMMRGSLAVAP